MALHFLHTAEARAKSHGAKNEKMCNTKSSGKNDTESLINSEVFIESND